MAARITVSTINLRFNRHLLAFMKFCNILSDLCDLSGYFMPLGNRISGKGVFSMLHMNIRSTNPNVPDFH